MSEVPSQWRAAFLGDVTKMGSGGTPPSTISAYYQGGTIPWVNSGDLSDGLLSAVPKQITEAGLQHSSAKWVDPGSVLIAMYGATIGKLGLVGAPVTTNQAVAFLKPDSSVDPKFLFFYLLSQRDSFRAIGQGGAQPNISQSMLRSWPIPIPSLEEQRRIVAILEDRFSHLGTAEIALHAASMRTETLLESSLASCLSQEDTQEWRLKDLLAEGLSNGRSVPTEDGGFPVLRLTALKDGQLDLSERKGGAWTASDAKPFLVKEGDVMVSRGNGSLNLVGRCALVPPVPDPVAFPDTMIRVRPNQSIVLPAYLALIWNSRIVRRQIESMARTTAGIYKVNQRQLEMITLPVPGLNAQQVVVDQVGFIQDQQAHLVRHIELLIEQSVILRRSLLAAAFRGDLTSDFRKDA